MPSQVSKELSGSWGHLNKALLDIGKWKPLVLAPQCQSWELPDRGPLESSPGISKASRPLPLLPLQVV